MLFVKNIGQKLQLYDNGNGIVDVTQNDGIYSAIFPYVGSTPGFYSVQIIADDNEGEHDLINHVPYNTCYPSVLDEKSDAQCGGTRARQQEVRFIFSLTFPMFLNCQFLRDRYSLRSLEPLGKSTKI